ncbi:DUF485 domain-containing protein [Bacillus sp. NEB1478]|uniref:DUF485 domain-containing protein n=1 Tax=Bacillus sp. NEB1478 TaxID=3073816 RepID=UPI0028732357|nr:DUF485 domain-containing protein [Bacillus sp. NEB1478]WNB90223.1 DUF485 domain-containing protein [Bacillus sp. NEB1478]
MLPKKQPKIDQSNYTEIVHSNYFKQLMEKKKRFIVPMTLFFFVFYFSLPILTAYSDVLNNPAIGNISWAWVFAFAQFIMTWSLCIFYTNKAKTFDELADKVIAEMDKEASS